MKRKMHHGILSNNRRRQRLWEHVTASSSDDEEGEYDDKDDYKNKSHGTMCVCSQCKQVCLGCNNIIGNMSNVQNENSQFFKDLCVMCTEKTCFGCFNNHRVDYKSDTHTLVSCWKCIHYVLLDITQPTGLPCDIAKLIICMLPRFSLSRTFQELLPDHVPSFGMVKQLYITHASEVCVDDMFFHLFQPINAKKKIFQNK